MSVLYVRLATYYYVCSTRSMEFMFTMRLSLPSSVLILSVTSIAGLALAQPCTPAWNRTVGTPGAPSSYVDALIVYQGDLVVNGAFPSMGGVASTQYLARYNRSTNTWSSFSTGLGSGISNAFGTSLAEYNDDLYVGGFFADATGVPNTKSIARWDGQAFSSLGTNWAFDSVNAVWSLLATDAIGGQNRLYIGGSFETIAGQPAGSVASWDGTNLVPIATSMTIEGINPLVTIMTTFDDGQGGGTQLYIGGRFTTVNGVTAPLVARWNGSTWSAVGTNLAPRFATAEVDAMVVWDDGTGPALYIGGTNLRVNADGINRATAKWNGTTWSPVGQALTGRTWSLATWDDGSGEKLYAAGTQAAVGFLYRLENNVWTALDGGASAQAIGLLVDENNTLYAGGSFVTVGGQASNRLVSRTSCRAACGCAADYNTDGGVDGGDVEAFFSDWSASIGCSDVNLDGGTDGSDVEAFFNVWAAGGC